MKSFFLIALGLAASSLFAQGGYVRATDPTLPAAIGKAAASVFRLVPRLKQPVEYHPDVFAVLLETPDAFTRTQLQRAKKAAGRSRVISVDWLGYGSAFLLGDQRTLISARHTWDEIFWQAWLKEINELEGREVRVEALLAKIAETQLEFDLYDAVGKKIFSPEQGDHGNIIFVLNYRFFEELRGKDFSADPTLEGLNDSAFDFIGIQLSRPLAGIEPLQLADAAPDNGGSLYGLGFPSNYDANYSRPTQATGPGLWVSRGRSTSFASGARALKMKNVTDAEAQEVFHHRILFVDSESGPGLSGGPLVNAQGRVVSLVSAGLWDGAPAAGKPITSVPSPGLFKLGTTHFMKLFQAQKR